MKQIIDQIGVLHSFEFIPKRIVSLVPSQTELLCDLGLEDSIIGITKFCVHPFHLKNTKTIVGGTKSVHFEKIKALNPDIIICNKEENTKEIVEELQNICPVWVTDILSIEDNLQMISDFGEIFNKKVEAKKWITKINLAHTNFKKYIQNKKSCRVAYFIWAKPYMVAGKNTFINEILNLNKFENIYKNETSRYPEIKIDELYKYKPDYLLLSSEPFPFKDEHVSELNKYFKNSNCVFVDGEMFSWYGSRLVKAFNYFMQIREKMT